jgi:hypothetical protein
MRFLLLAFSLVLISCNQSKKSSGGGSPERQNEEFVTNVREVDLLDVSLDVPIEISGNKIIFKQAANDSLEGASSSCSINVASEEAYSFKVDGDALEINTSAGKKMSFRRISGSANSIIGSWTGKFIEGSQLVLRRMTFVSESRLVMRTHCEH